MFFYNLSFSGYRLHIAPVIHLHQSGIFPQKPNPVLNACAAKVRRIIQRRKVFYPPSERPPIMFSYSLQVNQIKNGGFFVFFIVQNMPQVKIFMKQVMRMKLVNYLRDFFYYAFFLS